MAQGGLQVVARKLSSSRAGSFIPVFDSDDTLVSHRPDLRPIMMSKFFVHFRSENDLAASVGVGSSSKNSRNCPDPVGGELLFCRTDHYTDCSKESGLGLVDVTIDRSITHTKCRFS